MSFLGGFLGQFIGALFGDGEAGRLALTDVETAADLDEYATGASLDDLTTSAEINVSYEIKAGNRLISLSGRITVPAGVDLSGVGTFDLVFRGATTPGRMVEVTNDGIDPDGPALDADPALPTIWLWSYDWEEGETDAADVYEWEVTVTVEDLPLTCPNVGVGSFTIHPRLAYVAEED